MADKPFLARHGLTVGDNLLVVANTGKVSVGAATANVSFEVIATDAIMMPSGNTGQRPTGINGYFRYNNQTHVVEAYINGAWGPIGGTAVAANVSGPASSTNNNIALFDGTTGALLKNSLVSISTTGKITTVAANTTTAGLNLPHGTSPSSAVNGDIWTTSTSLSYRLASTDYVVMPKSGGTFTGPVITDGSVTGNAGMANSTGTLGQLEIRNNGTGAAMMTFHRTSTFAGYFGIDTDNIWKVGGWSHGNVAYKVWHEGLFTPVNKAGDTLTGNLNFGHSFLSTTGDIWSARSSANSTGVVYLGNSGNRYLYYDGTNYLMPGSQLYVNGSLVWHAGNFAGGSSYLPLAGGTLTGDVTLSKTSPTFLISKAASGQHAGIQGQTNGSIRWLLSIGDSTAESGSNAGSDFSVYRYNDAGSFLGASLIITRSTGIVWLNGGTAWSAGNDGAGSGLDADTVDGSHASAFALSGHTHSGYAAVNDQTSSSSIDYPVGTLLLVDWDAAGPNRNSTVSIYIGGDSYSSTVSGSALTGTWRACGTFNTGGNGLTVLAQRVA